MTSLEKDIRSHFGVDISKENVYKLYDIKDYNILEAELREKFKETRERLKAEKSRISERKLKKYEKLLLNSEARRAVFDYYKDFRPGNSTRFGTTGYNVENIHPDFAETFFSMIIRTKNIEDADVRFFLNYFKKETNHSSAVVDMLEKKLKVRGLKYVDCAADVKWWEDEFRRELGNSVLVGRFRESTILGIGRVIELFDIVQRNYGINYGIYEYLQLDGVKDLDDLIDRISQMLNQSAGPERELFNCLIGIVNRRDVADNLKEFCLLFKYPSLIPYMYMIKDMKKETFHQLLSLAWISNPDVTDEDFINDYYLPVSKCFGINNGRIYWILRKKKRKYTADGEKEKQKKIPLLMNGILFLAYWPLILLYLAFEVLKDIMTEIHRLSIPVFLVVFAFLNWAEPKLIGFDNFLALKNLFSKSQWAAYLTDHFGADASTWFGGTAYTVLFICMLLLLYVIPAYFFKVFIEQFSLFVNERFDWEGLERTFGNMFLKVKERAISDEENKKSSVVKFLPGIIVNLVGTILIVALLNLIPTGTKMVGDHLGYSSHETVAETEAETEAYAEAETTEGSTEAEPVYMTITVDSANIRSGPGMDYDVVLTATRDQSFISTGAVEESDDGRTWYEIYLNEEQTQTGWASGKVIAATE